MSYQGDAAEGAIEVIKHVVSTITNLGGGQLDTPDPDHHINDGSELDLKLPKKLPTTVEQGLKAILTPGQQAAYETAGKAIEKGQQLGQAAKQAISGLFSTDTDDDRQYSPPAKKPNLGQNRPSAVAEPDSSSGAVRKTARAQQSRGRDAAARQGLQEKDRGKTSTDPVQDDQVSSSDDQPNNDNSQQKMSQPQTAATTLSGASTTAGLTGGGGGHVQKQGYVDTSYKRSGNHITFHVRKTVTTKSDETRKYNAYWCGTDGSSTSIGAVETPWDYVASL